MVGRIPVMRVTPVIEGGQYPAKATVGESFPVSAVAFREGHDAMNADVVLTGPDGKARGPVRMRKDAAQPDLWHATVTPDEVGAWSFAIEAWSDSVATWRHDAEIKIPAGIDVELMFTEGALLLDRLVADLPKGAQRTAVADAATAVRDTSRPEAVRYSAAVSPDVEAALATHPIRDLVTTEGPFPFFADRQRALYGSWYEFFPRSEGAFVEADPSTGRDKVVSGTFRTAAKRLDAVAAMGFDIIYLPPIHPIGTVNRKGRNNTLDPGPDDVGSPWAIGSAEGGHDAIHPDLGTEKDFAAFVERAHEVGLEVALDLALQAAPDHPWVKSNPEWFTTRADGTIAYAENPPKKYQDIYPINSDNDPDGIYNEVLRIVRLWMSRGVRVFRVDNPHTKPVEFWEWLLAQVRETDPDVLFLAEAFTKPAMMRGLGTVGFHQSYTYFTWRTAKWELEEYFTELATETAHVMRPNFFVNTPDILHGFLQYGGPAAFKIRAALAATGSPTWGVYAGYELFEHVALKPGSEEYLDTEKFQIRVRDWDAADESGPTLAPYLTMLNDIRRRHPALQQLRDLVVHSSNDDATLVFSKTAGTDTVIVVVNVDPHGTRETSVHLNMPALGMGWNDQFAVHDEISGETWTWGEHNFVRLDPHVEPAHILTIRRPGAVTQQTSEGETAEGLPEHQPDWFRTAVFYEVLVRSFKDSNGDGVGDFRGLTEKLDYLQWLGVDCLWVPPFMTSPLRDGGYDVADYTNILPEVGTVEDFAEFLHQSHLRGIRVIIDFVMNHTSDQHPWFQSSRSDPDGAYGDFYVWSDTDELYEDARVIFVDTEPSNWTWDPVRQQYFWHRFYSHQPDLNFDNPKVHEAMFEGLSFWLDMGIDGFRLDAVPYLYERPGSNGENLKETHDFLKTLRRFVDEKYPNRVLLAEANQWPSDVVDYFGGATDEETGELVGDECHMCFHFPVMPRIFMAVRRESRFPISEILEQTPAIPANCQWGIFLRNHDELTLEMVADEDRDYMWGEYSKDPRMKANIGIRRRLAPLLDNDVNTMELFTALLLSLPGSPVLYYGDEIGMGDNIWLSDRDGVRTPMQWTPDRNAGFSSANPGRLALPPVQDPVFGYQRVNVETELENASSLLHWTRRMIHSRKKHPAFGLGDFTDLGGSNPSVLSYVREHVAEDGTVDTVVCVNNLSRFPQPVELDLRRYEGVAPVELLGGVRFPVIGELPYLLTLGGYGFYWFRLPSKPAPSISTSSAGHA